MMVLIHSTLAVTALDSDLRTGFPASYESGIDEGHACLTQARIELIETLARGEDARHQRKNEAWQLRRLRADQAEFRRVCAWRAS